MITALFFALVVQSDTQGKLEKAGLTERDLHTLNAFMNVGHGSDSNLPALTFTKYREKVDDSGESRRVLTFDNKVEAICTTEGFLRYISNWNFPMIHRPYPLKDTPVREDQAKELFASGVARYEPKYNWQVMRMDYMRDATSGNGVWFATGFGFDGYPQLGGTRLGPAAAVEGQINADAPRFDYVRMLELPSVVSQKPKIKITPDKADQIAVGLSLRGSIMLQPEVREHAELIISCDSLGVLRSVPGVGATRNWMRRDHPKVKALKGANMGIYGYLVEVRSALSLSECMRSNSAWEITYLIDPEDGSMIAGYDPKGK